MRILATVSEAMRRLTFRFAAGRMRLRPGGLHLAFSNRMHERTAHSVASSALQIARVLLTARASRARCRGTVQFRRKRRRLCSVDVADDDSGSRLQERLAISSAE
jgi:hypothetical protein